MTVQAANRNANQHHPSGTNSKFSGGDLDSGKNPIGLKFEPHQQKYLSTSSAIQLKAKFGHGRKNDNNNNNDVSPGKDYSKDHGNVKPIDEVHDRKIKSNLNHGVTNKNKFEKEAKISAPFTPPNTRKGGGIGLKWEMQHSQESSSSLTSWKTRENNLSKSHSNIQDLVVDDGRGFIPSEVAKDPNQKEFLIDLSKRIFSNPATKVIQEELQRKRTEQLNAANRKRSLSAGRNAGLDL
jgi:hypothetical protein